MLSKLIHVANKLDEIGKYKEADYITNLVTKIAQTGNFPPDDDEDDIDFDDEDLGTGEGDEEISFKSYDDEESRKLREKLPDMLSKQKEMLESGEYMEEEDSEDSDIVDEFASFVTSIVDGNYVTIEEVREAAKMLVDMHKDWLDSRSMQVGQNTSNRA